MADIPVISCTNCAFFVFDPLYGDWSCTNPENPDRQLVDDYGFFDCDYCVEADPDRLD